MVVAELDMHRQPPPSKPGTCAVSRCKIGDSAWGPVPLNRWSRVRAITPVLGALSSQKVEKTFQQCSVLWPVRVVARAGASLGVASPEHAAAATATNSELEHGELARGGSPSKQFSHVPVQNTTREPCRE